MSNINLNINPVANAPITPITILQTGERFARKERSVKPLTANQPNPTITVVPSIVKKLFKKEDESFPGIELRIFY